MKLKDIASLARLADAVYRHEQRAVSSLLAEERALRTAIAALDASERELAAAPLRQTRILALSGADVAWRAWAGRQRNELNAELARTLARKSREMARVRQAFGRREALRLLQDGSGRQR